MTEQEFKRRTKKLAVETAKLVSSLPKSKTADIYATQLIRSSASVGANYRSACRARSDAEMASKLGIAEEEADESQYWIELLVESGDLEAEKARPLHNEFNEIVSLLVASRRTLRSRIKSVGSVIREDRKPYRPDGGQIKQSSNRQSTIEQ